MKTIAMLFGFISCLTLGLVAGAHSASAVGAAKTELGTAVHADPQAPIVTPDAEMLKSCTHNADCSHGGCSGGSCGSCSNNSECKGWGGCKGGRCGSCSNKSDCGSFGD